MLADATYGTPLPQKPARIPIGQLPVKEAVGIAFWNKQYGSAGRVYLAKTSHPETKVPLARFFGGTAVPNSPVSSWNQSLLWIQEYLETPIFQEAIAGFIVLHRAYYFEQPMFENALNSLEQSHGLVPGHEIHGIVPSSETFLAKHAEKLVEIGKDMHGNVSVTPDLALNNGALAKITEHFLRYLHDQSLGCK